MHKFDASLKTKLVGLASYLPEHIVTNEALAQLMDTSDEWITTRTGIKQRHWAGDKESVVSMGTEAARKVLNKLNLTPKDIDAVIVATASGDEFFPSSAARIHGALAMPISTFAFDISAACSGFVYAIPLVDSLLKTGQAKRIMVIASEKFSRFIDKKAPDRNSAILFGDGASAIVFEATTEGTADILATKLFTEGSCADQLCASQDCAMTLAGSDVFKNAIVRMAESSQDVLLEAGLAMDDIAWIVPHQANLRIIKAMSDLFKMPLEKIAITIDKHANTSAASIPLALESLIVDGRLQRGQKIILTSFGAGFTWGSCVLEY